MKKMIMISIITIIFITNLIILVSADNRDINGTFNPFSAGDNVPPSVNWVYPVNGEASESVLLTNISVSVSDNNGDTLDIYFFTNKTDTWDNSWNAIGSNLTVTNGTYMCNQTFNMSQRYNTRWRWRGTTYYWSINITDGEEWTNNTYHFTTEDSRYDIDNNDNVFVGDLADTWANKDKSYLGLYDVDMNENIFVGDLAEIWAHH